MGNVDSFIYLSAVVNGFKYLQSKKSIAYFRMPSNVKDFIKWQIRNNANLYALTKKFKNLPLTEYKKPFLLFNYFKLIELIKNPIGSVFVFFMGIYILSQTKKSAESFNITWDVISSTKNVTA
jgi:hypothetical protein